MIGGLCDWIIGGMGEWGNWERGCAGVQGVGVKSVGGMWEGAPERWDRSAPLRCTVQTGGP